MPTPTTFEETAKRIREVNENLFGLVKESGQAALDSYETAVQSLVEFEKAATGSTQIAWVKTVTNTHAKFVEDITGAYLQIAREALK
ncbi:hypothetical protein [[Mycobacterium] crassicus]|uniref:Phasin domain-containing protein n=1 Tax=[Mycobacterium] crassicus TaxID=2872309 RepID=A0ABU5XJ31_9MYCO|nr:hypothetical protein [Mycolicibacter sp. MYC098]MEB3022134.1 hypothetical protein [Mycolicibacter sp. MYC098]